jgi:hypothetical protein
MMKALSVALGLALALGTTAVLADDDDDDKAPAAEVEKIEAVLSEPGCSGYESLKKEEEDLRNRRCQVQDGHHGHQARQERQSAPHLALLGLPKAQAPNSGLTQVSSLLARRRSDAWRHLAAPLLVRKRAIPLHSARGLR